MVRYGTLMVNVGRANTHNIFEREQLEKEKENKKRVASQKPHGWEFGEVS